MKESQEMYMGGLEVGKGVEQCCDYIITSKKVKK